MEEGDPEVNKFEQVSSDGRHGEESLSSEVPCWGAGRAGGGPCSVTSQVRGHEAMYGEVQRIIGNGHMGPSPPCG